MAILRSLLLLVLLLVLPAACLSFHQGPMPGEPKDATWLTVQGARVRYVDVGKGPAVVLLHGFASSLETWSGLLPELARDHRVIAMDLKGFGWTDRPAGDYSPEAQARLVRAVLDARGVERAAVVAHSWGSSVALALALMEPERTTRIVLYDAWVYDDQLPPFFRWSMVPGIGEALFALYYKERPDDRLALGFRDRRAVTQKLAEDVDRALDRPGTTAAALAAVRGEHFDRLERRYRDIHQSVLLLWGSEDGVALPQYAERLQHELPSARTEWFPQCGHFPMLEAPAQSQAAVRAFLKEAP